MTKSKQRQSLSGTVLIMILTVMFVLIIMLMATLTVVTTASQRIYTKFEENQAYYTSRSALEVVTTKMLQDGGYIGTNSNISAPMGTDEYQGFQMQAALYTVKVKDEYGNVDPDKNENIYGSVTKDFIEYAVTLPKVGNASDTYGNFSDGNEILIKMEVLDRVYDCGADGTYATGNRADDKLKVKITATSEVNGVEGTASVLIEAGPKTGANNTTRAVTTLGGATMTPNNNAILGGIATGGDVDFGNQGDYWGNVYIGGDIDTNGDGVADRKAEITNNNGGTRITLIDDEWYYINGDVTEANNAFPLQGFTNVTGTKPVVYVDGDFKIGQSGSLGTASNPITLFVAGDFETTGTYTQYGDLYVMGDCKPLGNDFTIYGNIYVKGAADFTACQNGTNIRKDATGAGGNAYFDAVGIQIVQFRLNAGGVHGIIEGTVHIRDDQYANSVDNTTWVETSTIPMPTVTTEDVGTSDEHILIEFPDGIDKVIPTSGALYTQFYRYHDMTEGCITASEYAFTSQEDFDNQVYSQQRIHEYYNTEAAGATQIAPGTNDTYATAGKYHLLPGQNTFVQFNTGGEVELFIEPGNYGSGGGVIVHPGTKLKVYCIPGEYNFDNFYFSTPQVEGGTGNLYVGDKADPTITGDPTAALMDIPTTFYIEGESVLNLKNSGAYLVAHVYGPRATINASTSGTAAFVNRLYYNNVSYNLNKRNSYDFTILGSILADTYNTGGSSKGSVAYVKTDDASTPPPAGQPFLNFKEVKYSRK